MKREQQSEEQKCTGYENRPRWRGKKMEWAVFQDSFELNIAGCLFVDTCSTLPQHTG